MMGRPRLLDLFCGAGGCAVGYHRAGFDVVGVDHEPQPRYPFAFAQGDALEYLAAHGREYDAIHASPPCQAYVGWRNILDRRHPALAGRHPNLVAATRELLEGAGQPWVIENVQGSPLRRAAILCGTMFGLGVRRHRLFESSVLLLHAMRCQHTGGEVGVYGDFNGRRLFTRRDGTQLRAARGLAAASEAMDIDWMTRDELSQAIPPAYTEWVGRQLLAAIEGGRT